MQSTISVTYLETRGLCAMTIQFGRPGNKPRLSTPELCQSAAAEAIATIAPKILRQDTVLDRTGLSRTTLWRLRRAGDFPEPVQLTTAVLGWIESEINDWIAARTARRA